MKAGAFTPATRVSAQTPKLGQCHRSPLNEGGGLHPRNPVRPQVGCHVGAATRSMKAGAFTPATHALAVSEAQRVSP